MKSFNQLDHTNVPTFFNLIIGFDNFDCVQNPNEVKYN